MKIQIKKLSENAVIPKYSLKGDVGLDLTATSIEYDQNGNICYGTGIAIKIPDGFFGMIVPRSSNKNKDLLLSNSCGIIDSEYVGEIKFFFKPSLRFDIGHLDGKEEVYSIGDRVGQLIILPYPTIEFEEVDELPITERGDGGFGSTGN